MIYWRYYNINITELNGIQMIYNDTDGFVFFSCFKIEVIRITKTLV